MNAPRHTSRQSEPADNWQLIRLLAHGYHIALLIYLVFFFIFRQKIAVIALGMLCNSLLTILFYRADKSSAQSGARRIPERILHLWELFGGWPGALIARNRFHHKNRKISFLLLSYLMILLNLLLIWGADSAFRRISGLIKYVIN